MNIVQTKKKILIVDDTPENIHILVNILKNDYTIIAATSGKKALEIATKPPHPDIILLDVIMPGMSGLEVYKELREHTSCKSLPIIFVTAQNEDENGKNITFPEDTTLVQKPVEPELLKKEIDQHIS